MRSPENPSSGGLRQAIVTPISDIMLSKTLERPPRFDAGVEAYCPVSAKVAQSHLIWRIRVGVSLNLTHDHYSVRLRSGGLQAV